MITFPPIVDKDEKPEHVYGLQMDVGPITVTFMDEGGGTYAAIKISDIDEEWLVSPDEMMGFARWLKTTCDTIDRHNNQLKNGTITDLLNPTAMWQFTRIENVA